MTSWSSRRTHLTWPHISVPRARVLLSTTAVVGVVVVAVVAALLMLPVFRVRHVQVVGERQVSEADVLRLAAVPDDTAMIRLGVDAISARVATLPAIARVKVVRVWPDTVRIEVDERRPVAYTQLAGGGYGLIDPHGQVYRAIDTPPTGLPQVAGPTPVNAPGSAPADPSMAAAVDVARRLPPFLARRVETVWAASTEDVRLQLRDGDQVRWGGTRDGAAKARVLRLLLRHPASVYDVSAPDAPATSP